MRGRLSSFPHQASLHVITEDGDARCWGEPVCEFAKVKAAWAAYQKEADAHD